MKRRGLWITLLICFVIMVICSALFEMEWRHPSGFSGKVQVRYTIPVTMPNGMEGENWFFFWVAGHVERVQLVPTSGHNEHEFVMLYIKTTEGWYETPTSSLGGPIDWKRGVKVEFTYPEGMALRAKHRSSISGYYPALGTTWLRWRGEWFGFGGNHLDEGDITSVHFRNADSTQVTVTRTNGLKHGGGSSSPSPGMAVEVAVSDK